MRRILFIDSKGRVPEALGPYRELLDVHVQWKRPDVPNAEKYGTAFVHTSDEMAVDAVHRAFRDRPYFRISGGVDQLSEPEKASPRFITVPIGRFTSHLAAFIAAYVESDGVVDESVWRTFYRSLESTEPAASLPVYTLQPVWRTPGELDLQASLAPLVDLAEPHALFVPEHYGKGLVHDGLNLAVSIRLHAEQPWSRWPLCIGLTTPPDELLREDLVYALLFTPGISFSHAPPAHLVAPILTLEEHLAYLERIGIPAHKHAHDLANEWGVTALWDALPASCRQQEPAQVCEARWRIGAQQAYRHAAAVAWLRGSIQAIAGTGGSESENSLRALARAQALGGLNVLLLDDEAHAWGPVIEGVLRCGGGTPTVAAPALSGTGAQRLKAAQRAFDEVNPDLVLCDLRIAPEDHDANRPAQELTGAVFTRWAKRKAPHVPIISFTASRQSHLIQALQEVGADGYWRKPHPTDAAPATPYNEILLSEITTTLARYEKAISLWQLYRDLGSRWSRDDAYKSGWMPSAHSSATTPEETSATFDEVRGRIFRAYGLLTFKHNAYFEAKFGIDTLSFAFLQLWSTVTLLTTLYVQERLGNEMAVETYRVRIPDQSPGVVSWVRSRTEGRLSGALGTHSLPATEFEAALLAGVLLYLGEGRLANDFSLARGNLRRLRNRLEVIHGGRDAPTASVEDILDLARVIRTLLLLDHG